MAEYCDENNLDHHDVQFTIANQVVKFRKYDRNMDVFGEETFKVVLNCVEESYNAGNGVKIKQRLFILIPLLKHPEYE